MLRRRRSLSRRMHNLIVAYSQVGHFDRESITYVPTDWTSGAA